MGAAIEKFAAHPKLLGLRHVVQDEADEKYILHQDFNCGYRSWRGSVSSMMF